jgi:hypothetical protein
LCLSIYMPTHRAKPGTWQDPIRLKNLLGEAESHLLALGLPPQGARTFLKAPRKLVDDRLFWQYQDEGLAIFVSSRVFRYYRLPLNFQELVVVTDRFHIKPLLQLFSGDSRFFVLALSQNQIRLLLGSRHTVSDVEVESVPMNLSEALNHRDFQKQLQFHTRTPGKMGKRAAMFHGQGVGKDDAKDNLLRYFRQVNRGLQKLFKEERAPLVMAGVDYLLPIYREANTYPYLLDDGISGNPEVLKGPQLHSKAWEVMEPRFLKEQEDAVTRYREAATSEQGSHDPKAVVPAAYHGRIELLFVAVGMQLWGGFDPRTNAVVLHDEAEPGDGDLLDFAAVHTLLKGGTVYAVETNRVPDGAPLAAIFRY